jgi:hypothetical protein
MKIKLFCRTTLLTGLMSIACLGSAAEQAVWQIGKVDQDYAEFALAGNYNDYQARFPQGNLLFEIGKSDPARDWPYIQPGTLDAWAGAGPHSRTIRFELKDAPRGVYTLRVDLVDNHSAQPSLFTVRVGEQSADCATQRGVTGESLTNPRASLTKNKTWPQIIRAKIPAALLHQGTNEIALSTQKGSWLLYDALVLTQDPTADAVKELTVDQDPIEDPDRQSGAIREWPLTRKMEWKGFAISEPGYWCWSAYPVRDDDGKYHIFGERWPKSAWDQLDKSELRHYVADKPEGPYTFVDVPVPRGKKGEFDYSQIYPCVQRNGKGWAMIYTGLNPPDSSDMAKGFDTMRPGVALADSLNGPWRKMGMAFDLPKDPRHWAHPGEPDIGIHVATFVQFHGKWFAYFKAGKRMEHDFMGVAVADRPEGPYQIMDKPCILKDGKRPPGYIEDMFPFVMNDKVYLAVCDNYGGVSGLIGGIVIFESNDGLTFDYNKVTLAVKQIAAYYKEFSFKKAKRFYGSPDDRNTNFEAPRFLMIDGKPAYFFGISGYNVQGGDYPLGYVMKIEK